MTLSLKELNDVGKQLKPCPFCGSEAILGKTENIFWEGYYVTCCGEKDGYCIGLNGSYARDTYEEVIEGWNKRV